VAWASWLMIF